MISRSLILIHASLTLLIPVVIALFITGCDASIFSDGNKNESMTFGPETSTDAINAEIDKVYSLYDPNTMKVGEWAELDGTLQVNGQVYLSADYADTVMQEETDDPGYVTFRTKESRRDFNIPGGDLKQQVDLEFPITFMTSSSTSVLTENTSMSASEDAPGQPYQKIHREIKQLSDDAADGGTVTYHNLQTSMSLQAPPSAVANSADCSKIFPNCQIRVYTVSYDMIWQLDGQPQKIQHEIKLSPDVPLLGAVLSDCQSGVFPTDDDQRVFEKVCKITNNFKFGTGSN